VRAVHTVVLAAGMVRISCAADLPPFVRVVKRQEVLQHSPPQTGVRFITHAFLGSAMHYARYKVDPLAGSAEDFVVALAVARYQGEREKAGMRLLTDYRKGLLGPFALELPAETRSTLSSGGSDKGQQG